MADLITHLEHRRGTAIYVNGTTYPIDKDGVVRDIPEVDATKLLSSNEWAVFSAEQLAMKKSRIERAREQFKASRDGLTLLDEQGRPIRQPEPAAQATQPAPEVAGPPPLTPEEIAPIPLENLNPGIDEGLGLDEWPEPTMEMSKAYLQEMADAYDVKYHKIKTNKPDLIKAIKAVMFEPDEE